MTLCAKQARSIKPAGKEDANLSAKQFLFSLYLVKLGTAIESVADDTNLPHSIVLCVCVCTAAADWDRVKDASVESAVNICTSYNDKSTNLTLVSPGFPHSYPPNTECRCIVMAQRHSKVSILVCACVSVSDKQGLNCPGVQSTQLMSSLVLYPGVLARTLPFLLYTYRIKFYERPSDASINQSINQNLFSEQ